MLHIFESFAVERVKVALWRETGGLFGVLVQRHDHQHRLRRLSQIMPL
jgi:hypothetical protein